MARSAAPQDLVAQMQRMQEQIRQLRLKRAGTGFYRDSFSLGAFNALLDSATVNAAGIYTFNQDGTATKAGTDITKGLGRLVNINFDRPSLPALADRTISVPFSYTRGEVGLAPAGTTNIVDFGLFEGDNFALVGGFLRFTGTSPLVSTAVTFSPGTSTTPSTVFSAGNSSTSLANEPYFLTGVRVSQAFPAGAKLWVTIGATLRQTAATQTVAP